MPRTNIDGSKIVSEASQVRKIITFRNDSCRGCEAYLKIKSIGIFFKLWEQCSIVGKVCCDGLPHLIMPYLVNETKTWFTYINVRVYTCIFKPSNSQRMLYGHSDLVIGG